MAGVLEEFTGAGVGQHISPEAYEGAIVATLDDGSSAFTGVFLVPSRTGTVAAQLDADAAIIQGISVQPGAQIVVLTAVLEDAQGVLVGSTLGAARVGTRVTVVPFRRARRLLAPQPREHRLRGRRG